MSDKILETGSSECPDCVLCGRLYDEHAEPYEQCPDVDTEQYWQGPDWFYDISPPLSGP